MPSWVNLNKHLTRYRHTIPKEMCKQETKTSAFPFRHTFNILTSIQITDTQHYPQAFLRKLNRTSGFTKSSNYFWLETLQYKYLRNPFYLPNNIIHQDLKIPLDYNLSISHYHLFTTYRPLH